MSDEVMNQDIDLSQFGVEDLPEEVELHEDREGFAKGFPDWDLRPPKSDK